MTSVSSPMSGIRTKRKHRGRWAWIAVVAVAVMVVSGLVPGAPALAAPTVLPAAGVPDVRNPGSAGRTVYHRWSLKPFKAVLIAPGIAVTNRRTTMDVRNPSDQVLSADDWQDYANKMRGLLDEVRRVPQGAVLVDAIPALMAPGSADPWTSEPYQGHEQARKMKPGTRSDVGIVLSEPAPGEESGLAQDLGRMGVERPAGSGSLIRFGRSELGVGVGQANVQVNRDGTPFIPGARAGFEHELYHSAQSLAGAAPDLIEVGVPTPILKQWPSREMSGRVSEVQVDINELLTQGGEEGLTATRKALTSAGPNGEKPMFTEGEYSSIRENPYLTRSAKWALDQHRALPAGAPDRGAWEHTLRARAMIAAQPPTELVLGIAQGDLIVRDEYQGAFLNIGGEDVSLLPVETSDGFSVADALNPVDSPRVRPQEGTWENPRVPDTAASAPPGGAGPPPNCASCGRRVSSSPMSEEKVAAFDAQVRSELELASEMSRGAAEQTLAELESGSGVSDMVALLEAEVGTDALENVLDSGKWRGVEERWNEALRGSPSEEGGHAFDGGSAAMMAVNLLPGFVMGLAENDPVAAVTSLLPPVQLTMSLYSALDREDYLGIGSSAFMGASMVAGGIAGEVLGGLGMAFLAIEVWSTPSDATQCFRADQQAVLAYQRVGSDMLQSTAENAVQAVLRVVAAEAAAVRYRSDFLQTLVDIAALQNGWDQGVTGGKPDSQELKRQIVVAAEQQLERLWEAGRVIVSRSLEGAVKAVNTGAPFRKFIARWVGEHAGMAADEDGIMTVTPTVKLMLKMRGPSGRGN